MEMFDWLICYMTKISYERLQKCLKKEQNLFNARNESQVFYAKTLAIIFIEVFKIQIKILFYKF